METYNLTNPQKTICQMEQYYNGTNINNICGTVTIKQDISLDKLNEAINIFVQNNKSFRLNFKEENGKVIQFFTEQENEKYEIVNLKDYKAVQNLAQKLSEEIFDIYGKKLYKFVLYKLENGHGGFIVLTHHIISDGATLALVGTEIPENYRKLILNEKIESKDYSYEDYIQDEEEYMKSTKFKKDEEYWNNLYSDVPEVARIPSITSKKNVNSSGKAKRKEYLVENSICNQISEFCKKNKISTFNFFMAIYSIYLSRVSNLKDFVIGTPILNRSSFKEKHTAGMFINTVPLRITLNDNIDFITFVKKIAKDSLSMLRYQKYPYDMLLQNLRKKESTLPSLFDVMLSYQITKPHDKNIEIPYSVEWLGTSTISNGISIHIHYINGEDDLNISYDYQIEKYGEEDIENMHNRILYIASQVLENENILEKDIEIVTKEEKNQILYEFNNTKTDYPKDKTIIELFEGQVEKTPNNIAIVFEDRKLTYKELSEKVNALALYLKSKDVKHGDIVCMLFDKSIEMIVSILSVLKLGACYLPIDINYPKDRIDYIIEDSQSKIMLSTKNIASKSPSNISALYVDLDNTDIYNAKIPLTNLEFFDPQDTAYIMYTSGSTGRPKGVMVKNINVIRLVKNTNFIKFSENERILQTGSIVFDACTFEIWAALLNGFELYIIKKLELLDVSLFQKYLSKNSISILWLTAPLFNQLCESNPQMFSNVKYLLTGGDVLSPRHINMVRNANPNLTIINGYGPTENTTFSTCFTIDKTYENTIPIGRPIANSTAYVVSPNGSLMPIGFAGELWVGGDGVSSGYFNNPDLTNDKFIKNPFGSGMIYKTGDLVKWLPDGNIDFIGRIDNQVKIRGFRVELSEINNILSKFNNIKECTTIIRDVQSKKTICSYFTSKDEITISEKEIKDYLKEYLPNYMIPTYISQLDKMPLTVNGKIDKKQLPEVTLESEHKIINPTNEIQKTLLELFKTVLNLENISMSDSFFELGGDSLLAIKLIIYINEKLKIRISMQKLFDNPTIIDLSNLILGMKSSVKSEEEIIKAEKKEFYHLSSAQKRIYYSCKIAGEDTILYNVPGSIVFDKKPDIKKLNKCFEKLITKHSSLRTYFKEIDGEIYQKLAPSIDFKIEELSEESKCIDDIMNDFVKPFDLEKAPLFRACLVSQKDKYLLLFDMHHIICDGASLSIFTKDLTSLYNEKNLKDISLNYTDYAEWEFEKLRNNKLKEQKDFWMNEFKDDIPVLDFQTDYIRPNIQSFEGSKIYKTIDTKLAMEINSLAKKLDVSTFMLLLSAYYVLLFKYSNNEDIVVGTPTLGRDKEDLLDMIGMFVNTLPLRNHIESNKSFKDFVNTVKSNCIKAFDNGLYPFDELVNDLKITRDTSRSPLFDTMFIYQNNGITPVSFNNINSSIYIPNTNISKFDLSLEVIPKDNGLLDLNFEYCTKLFRKETIERFATHFINTIKKVIENCEEKISDIDILSEEEKHKILYEFNNTKMDYPKDKTIIDLFEEQVEKSPNSIAIVFEDKKLTYKQLNEKANNLAEKLIANKTEFNQTVSILLNRSIDMIVSIFACIKLGMTYVLIEKTLPPERIKYILKNSNSKLLITNTELNSNKFDINTILLDKYNLEYNTKINENHNKNNENACIIYTSGSTGNPKGVLLRQNGIINLVFAMNNAMDLKICNKFISHASVSFDMFAFELYCSILNGKTLYLTNDEEQKNAISISNIIIKNDIDFLLSTPSKIELLLSDDKLSESLSRIKVFLLGGEIFTNNLYNRMREKTNGNIYNGYGPTESTACCSIKKIENTQNINIGKPVNNTQIYILNNNLFPCPIGIIGELCVSGDGISAGYVNDKERTDKSFVNAKSINKDVYRTGDLAKFNDNGEIEYIGRSDFQVKLHGQRIELEEIEKTILNIKAINNVCVCIQKIQDREILSAYYTINKAITKTEIKTFLEKKLPSYMIPTYFLQLDELPITINGKIDRRKLPTDLDIDDDIVLPTNETENIILNIYKNILHIENIGISHNFFEIGGDSITAMKVYIECTRKNLNISYSDIFKFPTVEKLAKNLKSVSSTPNIINKCELHDFYPTSSAQKRIYLSTCMDENSTLYNIYGGILLDNMPDISKLQNALNIIVSRHESLRTYFEVIDRQIVQKIVDNLHVEIDIQNVNTNDPNELFYIYNSSFDLSKAPLFNMFLFILPNGKVLLMLDVHHIIFDGTSFNNFIKELSGIYNGNELPKLDISYKDFATWENDKLNLNGFKESKEFWINQFKSDIPLLNLPYNSLRPNRKNYEGKTFVTSLSEEFTEKINNFAIKHNVTSYMVMLACYYILLYNYTIQEDIIVGTAVSGRIYKELEPLLGMFVNSIPLRNTILPNMDFEEFLENIKNSCINAFAHQDYPVDMLINDLKINKDASRNPLFDTMFTYQSNGLGAIDFDGIIGSYCTPISNTSKFDILLEVLPINNELKLSFEYCTKLFDEIFIGNFANSYKEILIFILDNPSTSIANISIHESISKNNVVYKFNEINLHNTDSSENVNLFTKEINNLSSNNNISNDKISPYQKLNSKAGEFAAELNKSESEALSFTSPRNEIETQISDVFKKLLPVSDIGIDDNFFDLGGDSLTAINLQIELLKSNLELTYADIFEYPTIRTLAEKISANKN